MCRATTNTPTTENLPLNVDSSTPGLSGGDITNAPATVPVSHPTPTSFGRLLELGSMGVYDPTGGADSTGTFGQKPTKFGMLLRVLRPAVEGGLIGGFEGRSTPGGGFAAAQNFFMQNYLRQMKARQFMAEMAKTQSEIGKNQAEAANYNRGGNTRVGQPVVGDNGNYWQVNPTTRELEDTGVAAAGKTTQPDLATVPTNRGIVLYDRHGTTGTAVPLTLAGKAAASMEAGDGTSAGAPSAAAQGGVPKTPPKGSALMSPSGISAVIGSFANSAQEPSAEENLNSRPLPRTAPNGRTAKPQAAASPEVLQPAQKFTNPFEAFSYGNANERKAVQDFIALEGSQKLANRAPSDVEDRYQLFKKDPDAYKAMYGDRGSAQGSRDQAQATRMLNYFAKQRKATQEDFTLDDAEKQQRLSDIDELEKPYLQTAQPSGNAPGSGRPQGNARSGPSYKAGDAVTYNGQRMKVSKVRPDGKLELQPAGVR